MNLHAGLTTISAARAMQPVRAQGRIDLRLKQANGATVLADLAEAGGYRVKFPAPAATCEAVIINTGGGMTGGDALDCHIHAGESTDVTITTQSAEKLYRSSGHDATIAIDIAVEDNASLAWLPQETILFSGARVRRDIKANIAHSASLLVAETMIFGRIAMDEILGEGAVLDQWRIRRGGKLVYADNGQFAGDIGAVLMRPAVLRNARAISTILFVSPRAESLCEPVRAATASLCTQSGASAWHGMLLARCADNNPARLRNWVARVIGCLHAHPLPRVWQC